MKEALKFKKNLALIQKIKKAKKMPKGFESPIVSGDKKYLLKQNIGLVKIENQEQVAADDILAKKLGLLFVKNHRQAGLEDALAVVENEDSGELGILTGVISVKFKNYQEKYLVLKNTAADIVEDYPHLKIVHLKFTDLNTLREFQGSADKNSLVARTRIEILEYQKQGN